MWPISIVMMALAVGWLLARRLRRAASLPGTHCWIAFGTLFFATYLTHAQAAGAIAELTGRALFRPMMVAACLAVTTTLVIAATLMGSSDESRTCAPSPGARFPRTIRRRCWLLALPVLLLHTLLMADALTRPPEAFDGLFYHLPMIARWLKVGHLLDMPLDVPQYCHPSNCELWQWLPASAGWEKLIEPSMAPVAVLFALTAYALGREFGIRPLGAWVATLFVLCCPIVALQAYASYVELFGAAFTLGALLWALRCFRSEDGRAQRVYALLAGLSAGIALGTKLINVVWIAGIAMLFVGMYAWRRWRWPQQARPRPGIVSLVLLFGLGAGVCSAVWYVRNTVHTGWPLFPFQVRVAGVTLGSGFGWDAAQTGVAGYQEGQPPWQMFAYPWFEWKARGAAYSADNGLGPCFAGYAILGIPTFVFLRLRRRQSEQRIMAVGACVLLVGGVATWALILAYNVRYGLPVWSLVLVMSGSLVELLLRRHRYIATALVGATLTLGCGMVGIYTAKSITARLVERNDARAHFYGLIPEINSLPPGTVILNLAEGQRNYPLLGDGLKYDVIESMRVKQGAITLPVTQKQIDRLRIGAVYTRLNRPPPFAEGVRFEPLGAKGCAYRTFPAGGDRYTAAKHESK